MYGQNVTLTAVQIYKITGYKSYLNRGRLSDNPQVQYSQAVKAAEYIGYSGTIPMSDNDVDFETLSMSLMQHILLA